MSSIVNEKTLEKEELWRLGLYLCGIIPIFPFSNIVLPLVVWLVKKNDSTQVERHGRNVLNFQITMTLAVVALFLISMPMMFIPILGMIIMFLVWAVVTALFFGCLIYGGVKAYQGDFFKLPCSINFIKGVK